MGTSNFWQLNTSCIYACGIDDNEDEDFLWEYTRDNVADALEAKAKECNHYFEVDDNHSTEISEATSIGIYMNSFTTYGVEWNIKLIPQTIAGKYQGFSLDFDIEVEHSISSEVYDERSDWLRDIVEYNSDYLPHKGLFLANQDKINARIQKEIDILKNEVESVYEQFSTPLRVSAGFSNGETWYEKIAVDNYPGLDNIQDEEDVGESVVEDEADDLFPIIYTGSHYKNSERNKEAFNKINDILFDKKNPYYDIFNKEKLYLDDTNGLISLVQTNYEDDFSNIAQEIADYITSNVGFDGESFIFVGDSTPIKVDYNLNKLKNKQSNDEHTDQPNKHIRKNNR